MTAAALPPLASLAELSERMQRPLAGTPEEKRALAALADASALVRAEVPPGLLVPTVPEVVVTVVCQAAARAVRNPDGFSSETAGQYTYRYGEAGTNGVYLTGDDRAILRRLSRRSGLRSTRTPYGAGEHTDPPYRLPVLYRNGQPGEPFPWEVPPASAP
ncbi:hypothetical protein JOF53_007977 [Crossiella equi]|uniref:Head-to-tail adaptor n=1 Tax=Crossiella equi TaxID=130796 RepID=A0ABS5ARD4_9PSEU|nr:hypothetical protein [Crossiella equi]MBP2479105.1 hypothetical protein [Crossiella equi]